MRNFNASTFVGWTLRHGRMLWLGAVITGMPATLHMVSPDPRLEHARDTVIAVLVAVGVAITFALVLLARYFEERRLGVRVRMALTIAVHSSSRGTFAASAIAGVFYTALAFANFRDFRQFGGAWALGTAFAWFFSYVLLPPLVALLDQ